MDYLKKYSVNDSDIERIKNFIPRDEIYTMEENEFNEMVEAFSSYLFLNHSIPIFTDNESNFICLYISGAMKGKVFCNQHDDTMLAPLFKDLTSFLDFLDTNPQFSQIYQFSNYWKNITHWDYPTKNEELKNLEIIEKLQQEFNASADYFEQDNLAYSIMALTPYSFIEEIIYPFLIHEDFLIAEFAINMLGYYEYIPAIAKLEEMQKTAKSNAKRVLDKILPQVKNIEKNR